MGDYKFQSCTALCLVSSTPIKLGLLLLNSFDPVAKASHKTWLLQYLRNTAKSVMLQWHITYFKVSDDCKTRQKKEEL
jgi:hypothetical protein